MILSLVMINRVEI